MTRARSTSERSGEQSEGRNQSRVRDVQESMNISRIKFVAIFIVCGFAFLFVSNALFGTEARLFPAHGASFLGTGSPVAWKNATATVLLPIRIVLVGPMLPYIEFLRQEPDTPPPFFLIGFVFYWTILALGIHYLLGRIRSS
jgi:hypothetical protein